MGQSYEEIVQPSWLNLSDAELRSRLFNRGVDAETASMWVSNREYFADEIGGALPR
jgi:hypothetical protein